MVFPARVLVEKPLSPVRWPGSALKTLLSRLFFFRRKLLFWLTQSQTKSADIAEKTQET